MVVQLWSSHKKVRKNARMQKWANIGFNTLGQNKNVEIDKVISETVYSSIKGETSIVNISFLSVPCRQNSFTTINFYRPTILENVHQFI